MKQPENKELHFRPRSDNIPRQIDQLPVIVVMGDARFSLANKNKLT